MLLADHEAAIVSAENSLLAVDRQNSQDKASSQSTPTTPTKRSLVVIAAEEGEQPVSNSNQDSGLVDETNSTACQRKVSSDVDAEFMS